MEVKVAKFGGSSLSEARQFKKVKAIIQADTSRMFVVPSAPGKRTYKDEKVTDALFRCQSLAKQGQSFDEPFAYITERYLQIQNELGLKTDILSHLDTIHEHLLLGASADYAASRGEYLNGILLADYLGFAFIDAAELIRFDENGVFDADETQRRISAIAQQRYIVIPGFYGSKPDGRIQVFPRGGSDITGAIVARGVRADVYENWTDVSGFFVTNPRIVENPRPIEVVTFRELRELAYMGASVLHEDAVLPVKAANIPINIRNTNEPSHPGTLIVNNVRAESTTPITGIAGKRGFSIIHIEKDGMNKEVGFTRRALSVLENHNVSFEHLPSGIDTMGFIIQTDALAGQGETIAREISKAVNADEVELISGLALIAVVGRGMVRAKGVASRIMNAIARANINIRMLDQGSSELNIIIGVDEYDFRSAVNAIYAEFFQED